MKWVLALLVLLVLPLSIGLYEVKTFSGYVWADRPFQIDGQNYTAVYNKATNVTMMFLPGGITMRLDPDMGKCLREGLYSICETQQKFYRKGIEIPWWGTNSDINTSLYLLVNTSKAGIEITKNLDRELFFTENIVNVEVRLKRTGDFYADLENVYYRDVFSEDFDIIVLDGCRKKEGRIEMDFPVFTSEKACRYRVIPKKKVKYTNDAVLNYTVQGKKITTKLSKVFDVGESPFSFSISYINRTIGQAGYINITINALDAISIEEMKIKIPQKLKAFNISPGLSMAGNEIYLEKRGAEKGQTLHYYVGMNSSFVNDYAVDFALKIYHNYFTHDIAERLMIGYSYSSPSVLLFEKPEGKIIRISNQGNDTYADVTIFTGEESFNAEILKPRHFKEFETAANNFSRVIMTYRTPPGQLLQKNMTLNASVYSAAEGSAIEDKPTVAEKEKKKPINIKVDMGIVAVIAGCIAAAVVLFIVFSAVKSKFGKSELDREIERIKGGK